MSCSLEVKAPTLSTVPLYIRPTFEMKHHQKRMKENKRPKQIRDTEEDESGEFFFGFIAIIFLSLLIYNFISRT